VLDLSNNALGDEGAAALAASPLLAGLRVLHLGRTCVGDAGARALALSPHLGDLTPHLDGNRISAAVTGMLRQRLGERLVK
jgi:hypothetical protein